MIKKRQGDYQALELEGWNVFRFWDFEMKKDVSKCVKKITLVLPVCDNFFISNL